MGEGGRYLFVEEVVVLGCDLRVGRRGVFLVGVLVVCVVWFFFGGVGCLCGCCWGGEIVEEVGGFKEE